MPNSSTPSAEATTLPSPRHPKRWWRRVCVLFFTFHAFAIALVLFSSESRLFEIVDRPFEIYRALTGNNQQWNMFVSAPAGTSYTAVVRAYHGGNVSTFDPVTPGLMPTAGHGTYRKVFFVMLLRNPEFLDPYLERVCGEIEERTGTRPDAVELDVVAMRLYTLEEVRETRQLGFPDRVGLHRMECP